MYPVTGASGGAILSPLFKMPTKLVDLEPCQSITFENKLLNSKFTSIWEEFEGVKSGSLTLPVDFEDLLNC